MTEPPDDRTEEEVREETIEELLSENDIADLQRMRSEMRDELESTGDDREFELIEYRLDILLEAIDRVETSD